ncbi:hypothetical protein Vadar_020425 [Vaccinium darrowii]|uniref:Uncharacterized protein n=1 Tax=Vaccinium darrowii TaxID=229202 RepID=A0ACB7X2F7_9ERIC|nr:hypothetical protein Vadar_020425 [Vaccinium darrowii]
MAAFRRMENKHSANWAELQHDLLTLIAQRVGLLEDFSAFRRVCRSWLSVAAKDNFKGSQGIPWLMLPVFHQKTTTNVLMVIHGGFLGFWKAGEKAWTTIKTSPVAHALGRIPHGNLRCRRPYIAESKGEVLVVFRDGYDQLVYVSKNDCRSKYKFEVFTVDASNGECVELQSLGDNALFVGYNASISVQAAKFQGIRPNCI